MLALLRTSPRQRGGRERGNDNGYGHEPRHQRGACTPQGNALCLGVALRGLVMVAMILSWLFSLVGLFL
jgi:hypothetical protein